MVFDLFSNKVIYTCPVLLIYLLNENLCTYKHTFYYILTAFVVVQCHYKTKYANFVYKMLLFGNLKSKTGFFILFKFFILKQNFVGILTYL